MEEIAEIEAAAGGGVAVATAEDWRKALAAVVPAVVVLRTTAPRAFDTEQAGASYATGFVVDKQRGIILTNRHVVKPGPVVAEAMFVNREEISVHPIYRDPVHDFGFFRYDPGAVKFLKYEEIHLAPEAACVGLEIRVVGNDSGEKVNILLLKTLQILTHNSDIILQRCDGHYLEKDCRPKPFQGMNEYTQHQSMDCLLLNTKASIRTKLYYINR